MKKVLLISLLSIVLFSSCSKIEDKVLQVAVSQQPSNFDVQRNSTLSAKIITVSNVYEKLVTINNNGEVVPELASSFSLSGDATTYIFKLRHGVKFHNGKEMKAEDVVASMNRWINNYQVAKNIVNSARFEEVDEYTVQIKADKPILFLVDIMSNSPQSAVIMPKEIVEDLTETGFVKDYIGTGVYKFNDWQLDQYVELVKFDDYQPYGAKDDEVLGLAGYKHGYIERIRYHFVPDALIRTLSCENGDFAFINDVSNDDIERLEKKENLTVPERSEEGSLVLIFNKKSPITSDQTIRTAINTGIDFDLIMKACYGNSGYALHPNYVEVGNRNWLIAGLDGYYNQNDKFKAKEILEHSTYNGEVIKILTPNLSNMEKSAIALQSELSKIGIKSSVEIVDWATFMELRNDENRYDIFVSAFSTVPLPSLKHFLDPTYPGWSEDEHLATLMEAFNRSKTKEEGYKAWEEIQIYCYEYLPAIVLGHYQATYLWNDQIDKVATDYGFYFWNTRFKN